MKNSYKLKYLFLLIILINIFTACDDYYYLKNWNPNAKSLSSDKWADGYVSNYYEWFEFYATGSTYIHFNPGTLDSINVELFNRNGRSYYGERNLSTNNGCTSYSVSSGYYYIRVRSYTSGSYKIGFNTTYAPPGTKELRENIWTSGNIQNSNSIEWFKFSATASTQYIHLNFGNINSVNIELYDKYRSKINLNSNINNFNSFMTVAVSVKMSETYYIKVMPRSPSTTNTGYFNITFNKTIIPPFIELTENRWVDGLIFDTSYTSGLKQTMVWYRFTATANTQYIHIKPNTLDSFYVQVYDNTGNTIGSESSLSNSPWYLSRTLTNGQVYYIRVRPYNSNNTGTYQIAFNTSTTPPH